MADYWKDIGTKYRWLQNLCYLCAGIFDAVAYAIGGQAAVTSIVIALLAQVAVLSGLFRVLEGYWPRGNSRTFDACSSFVNYVWVFWLVFSLIDEHLPTDFFNESLAILFFFGFLVRCFIPGSYLTTPSPKLWGEEAQT